MKISNSITLLKKIVGFQQATEIGGLNTFEKIFVYGTLLGCSLIALFCGDPDIFDEIVKMVNK